MSTARRARLGVPSALALPALAVALVVALLAVQLGHGGGRYRPLTPADPCTVRPASTPLADLDSLTEAVVLQGVADAACSLGTSREALVLDLAPAAAGDTGADLTDAQVVALHDGLVAAVGQLADAGALPASSVLVNQAVDASDLSGLVKAAIRAVPDGVVDSALSTPDVLTRTVEGLDVRAVLGDLTQQQDLQTLLQAAVVDAVKASLVQRVRDLF